MTQPKSDDVARTITVYSVGEAIRYREALIEAREPLGRIASNGFGHPVRQICTKRDKEMLAMMDYARKALAKIDAALATPAVPDEPTEAKIEAGLHKLIDAARMYEASCRLGGKDQEFASLKLDKAKSAALMLSQRNGGGE